MMSGTAAADNVAQYLSALDVGTHKDDAPPVPLDYRWSTQAAEISPGNVSEMCPSAPAAIRAGGYDPSLTAYRPLSNRETRIITVWSGEPHKPLRLSVRNMSLDDEHVYAALSYTWRGQIRDVPVQLWSSPWTPHTILVTQSLIEALVRLRDKTRSFLLWVDQISINQADNIEKSSQVGMMGQIFRKASFVQVWLGGESADSDLAIDHLTEIHRILHKTRASKQSAVIDIGNNTPRLRLDILKSCVGPNNESNAKSWTAIANLVGRPWFARIWVIQEATALPSDQVMLMCGKRDIDFGVVSGWLPVIIISWWELWNLDRTGLAPVEGSLRWIGNLRRFNGKFGSPNQPIRRLSHLLEMTEDCEATDPRDKVFCMLQFASDLSRNDPDLRVDYSISLDEVCMNYVQWHVRKYQNLDFLGRCYRLQQQSERPRWLPDLSQRIRATFSPEPLSSQPHKATAELDNTWVQACGTESILISSEDRPQLPKALAVSGVRVGKVCSKFELSLVLDPTWTHQMQNKSCPLNRISMLESFLQAATGGKKPEAVSIEAVNNLQRMRCRPLDEWHLEPEVKNKIIAMFPYATFRCFFYIGNEADESPHLVGLGPIAGLAGVEIWMLKGGKTLYALAPARIKREGEASVLDLTGECGPVKEFGLSDPIHYYVGECFVPGLMKGELLDLMKMEPKTRPAPLEDMDSDFKTVYLF